MVKLTENDVWKGIIMALAYSLFGVVIGSVFLLALPYVKYKDGDLFLKNSMM